MNKPCNHKFKEISRENITISSPKTEEILILIVSECEHCKRTILHDENMNVYDYCLEGDI